MNKKPILIGVLTSLAVIGAAILLYTLLAHKENHIAPPSNEQVISESPEDRTARLASYLLIRKIESLRKTAIYVQHKEEGKRLLELAFPPEIDEEETEKNSEPGTIQ